MSEQHWLLYNLKSHCCKTIPGESRFLTRCGQRVHPLFLAQPKEDDERCAACQLRVETSK